MRPIRRLPLSPAAVAALAERARKVKSAKAAKRRKARVSTLWNAKGGAAFDEVRQQLRAMCSGLERCMYCEDSVGTDIEHFWPKSRYPLRAFDWSNYLLACTVCNSNHKRDEFPLDRRRRPLLIDPVIDDPLDSLLLDPATGEFISLDERGAESIRVFGLGRQTLVDGRRNAWIVFEALLERYGRERQRGHRKPSAITERALRGQPFSSLLWHLVALAEREDAAEFVGKKALAALEHYPEIKSWCV